MKKVGVTGGIGSGKSLVCKIFRCLNVPVFSADDEAKVLLENDPEIRLALTGFIGEELYLSGKLNKQMLAGFIFSDRKNMDKVNKAVHPAVFERFTEWFTRQTKSAYVIMEAAILFETGADRLLDKVINITAPEEIRIERVCKRDDVSKEQVIERINNQLSETERKEKADINLVNDGKVMLLPRVLEIHKLLSGNV
ncbi:MAG: dephospho-CoA kinase [Bacteroidales bacterium]|nr:dephospho-CoA kinase [Bacteroidales bacterium]